MKLTQTEKTTFAIKLKAMVDAAYAEETESPKKELSYLGVCKIATMVEQECEKTIGEFPDIIKGACHLARAFRNPDEIKSKEDMHKGFALLVSTAGGLSIVWGILSMLSLWTAFWVFVAGAHIPVFGPLAVAGGLAAVVVGVYSAKAKQTPQALSAKAHSLLIEAISKWHDQGVAKKADAKLIGEMAKKVQRVALRDFEGKYVSTDLNKGGNLIANRNRPEDWEKFTLFEIGGGKVVLLGCNKLLVSADGNPGSQLVSNQSDHQDLEPFEILPAADGRVSLRAANGKYVSCRIEDDRLLKACAEAPGQREQFQIVPVGARA